MTLVAVIEFSGEGYHTVGCSLTTNALRLTAHYMPDQRQHRGPHPEDQQLFAADKLPSLRQATSDLSWLLTRGYASPSALKIVGDRYSLTARQRVAVARCACGDDGLTRRQKSQVPMADLGSRELWIDGYNVLTTIEAALSGGVVLHARDGSYRDMASMHGTYRKVQETVPAIGLLGEFMAQCHVAGCRWLLDQPVSNSGRLKAMLLEIAAAHSWNWQAEVVADPDPELMRSEHTVATADSQVLDRVPHWFNLARLVIDARIPGAWIVDLAT